MKGGSRKGFLAKMKVVIIQMVVNRAMRMRLLPPAEFPEHGTLFPLMGLHHLQDIVKGMDCFNDVP
ncbi:MAG TPA: hypothetical protein VK187_02115 [Geobacteraceae bacterium]|nr:hypothetical protein [Geobacteraceae bacterium]